MGLVVCNQFVLDNKIRIVICQNNRWNFDNWDINLRYLWESGEIKCETTLFRWTRLSRHLGLTTVFLLESSALRSLCDTLF